MCRAARGGGSPDTQSFSPVGIDIEPELTGSLGFIIHYGGEAAGGNS